VSTKREAGSAPVDAARVLGASHRPCTSSAVRCVSVRLRSGPDLARSALAALPWPPMDWRVGDGNVLAVDRDGIGHRGQICTRRCGQRPRVRTACGRKLGSKAWEMCDIVTCMACIAASCALDTSNEASMEVIGVRND
jgi:hypothetical protein